MRPTSTCLWFGRRASPINSADPVTSRALAWFRRGGPSNHGGAGRHGCATVLAGRVMGRRTAARALCRASASSGPDSRPMVMAAVRAVGCPRRRPAGYWLATTAAVH
jgi:hypothetical protein